MSKKLDELEKTILKVYKEQIDFTIKTDVSLLLVLDEIPQKLFRIFGIIEECDKKLNFTVIVYEVREENEYSDYKIGIVINE